MFRAQPNMLGDEALARRLQMEELSGQLGGGTRDLGDERLLAQSAEEVSAGRGGQGTEPQLSDQELALLLQQEEAGAIGEAPDASRQQVDPHRQPCGLPQHPWSQQGRHPASEPQTLSDEELARMLQQEEEDAAAQHAVPRPPPSPRPPSPDHFLEGGFFSQGASSLPGLTALLRSGAFFGCCGGLQMAACLGCGHIVTWLCALGGGIAGHFSNSGAGPLGSNVHRSRHEEDDDDFFPDDSDEDAAPRGLDRGTIEGHTVDHIYEAPQTPQPAPLGAAGGHGGPASGGCSEEDRKCMVCMEAFATGDALRTLPCLHRYHRRCIDEWLVRSPECPICKRNITAAAVPTSPVVRPSHPRFARVRRMWNRRG